MSEGDPDTRRVTLALVGCGRMGRAQLNAIARCRDVQLAAVVDPFVDPGSLPKVDFAEVVASPRIDALLIAAPTVLHDHLISTALQHGKHVLAEKPLTLDPTRDLALGRFAEEQDLILQVGFWRRFADPYRLLRGFLARGLIGAPKAMRAAQWDAELPPLSFCDPGSSGGLEIDCGVHEFDLARWLLGADIEAVAASAPPPAADLAQVGDVDTIFGVARLGNMLTLAVDLARTAGDRDSIRTEIIGEHGALIADFAETGHVLVRTAKTCEHHQLGPDVIGNALVAQLAAFAHGIRAGHTADDAATATDSHHALLAAKALRQARLSGQWTHPED